MLARATEEENERHLGLASEKPIGEERHEPDHPLCSNYA